MFAAGGIWSVTRANTKQPTFCLGTEYREVAKSAQLESPRNTTDLILGELGEVILRQPKPVSLNAACYWRPELVPNTLEVVGAVVDFVDNHQMPIPATVFPPEQHVQEFLSKMADGRGVAPLPRQLDVALRLSGGSLAGAANLCWAASRFAARGGDTRAYPNIGYVPADPQRYSRCFAPFDNQMVAGTNDPAGDTYYFWTLVYVGLATRHNVVSGAVGRMVTHHGAAAMRFVRDNIAHHSTTSSHLSAVMLGEAAGPYLVDVAEQQNELRASRVTQRQENDDRCIGI